MRKSHRSPGFTLRRVPSAALSAAALAALLTCTPSREFISPVASVSAQGLPGAPIDGTLGVLERCDNFFVDSLLPDLPFFAILGFLFPDQDVPDPAWVMVRRGDPALPRFRDATGVVALNPKVGDYPGDFVGDESLVNYEDYPDVHDSHDQNFFVLLDPVESQANLVSSFGLNSQGLKPGEAGYVPDTLEIEWETGILTSARTGDGRFFPKWAWPLPGDRVWVNGYWIFDCGHAVKNEATDTEGLKSEIHPPRAIASMRQQVVTPPAGGAPMTATAASVYVHGRAGVVVDLLECGGRVIAGNRDCPTRSGETPHGSDSDDGDPSHDIALDHLGIPINETFSFTMCSPPQPPNSPLTTLSVWEERLTSYDTLDIAPQWEVQDASGACAQAGHGPKQVRVTLPLGGTAATPDDVYARRIYAGWSGTPQRMRRFRVTLNSLKMNDDLDHDSLTPGSDDCECAWFWTSIDKAADHTIRLSEVSDSNMNDVGDGETVPFTGATWDFTVPDGQPFTMRTFGYDGGVGEGAVDPKQDCLDDHFGHHDFGSHIDLDLNDIPDVCVASLAIFDPGDAVNDPFDVLWRPVESGEIDSLIGVWPATGSQQISMTTPLRCHVIYTFGFGTFSNKLFCESAQQVRDAYTNAGFQVLFVNEYRQYELRTTVDALPTDSDGDGLNDGDEINTHHTDPLDADSDDDGLSDGAEINTHHTDPLDADSDDDGLSDGAEVNTHHTDPLDPDTDDDGLPDGVEVNGGMDPLDADSDDDGIPDGEDTQVIANAAAGLPASAFRVEGNREALLDRLAAVERRIQDGDIAQALRELESLRRRVDGCGEVAAMDDWIVDCAAQLLIRSLIDLISSNLAA